MMARIVPESPTPRSLADAELNDRVARADARDRYRAAVVRARQQLMRDYAKADTALIAAQQRHRAGVAAVNALKERYHGMILRDLQDELSRTEYMLTPQYAVHMTAVEKQRTAAMVRLMRAELDTR